MSEIKCGCTLHAQYYAETDQTTYRIGGECLIREAVKLLEYIAAIGGDELARAGKTNLPLFGINAFLAKVGPNEG